MTGIERSNETPLDFTDNTIASSLTEADIGPLEGYGFPSLFTRVKAVFIDTFLMISVFMLSSYLIDLAGGAPDWLRASILITMLCLYEPILVAALGGTIGHHLMKIRIKNASHPERNINICAALFRLFLKMALGWLSFLTVTASKSKRAIHDMSSGSVVLDHDR